MKSSSHWSHSFISFVDYQWTTFFLPLILTDDTELMEKCPFALHHQQIDQEKISICGRYENESRDLFTSRLSHLTNFDHSEVRWSSNWNMWKTFYFFVDRHHFKKTQRQIFCKNFSSNNVDFFFVEIRCSNRHRKIYSHWWKIIAKMFFTYWHISFSKRKTILLKRDCP